MDNMDLYQSQVDLTLSLCSTICQMAANAKANKNNCQQVAQRVKVLEGLVHTAKQREHGVISPTVENALKEICSTLESAKTLMEKFSRNNSFLGLRNSGNHDDQFSNVDERLIDNFQVLSGALLNDQGKDLSSPTAPMSQPMNMAPMGYNPTAAMPQSSTMPLMTTYNPTASMPQPMNMAPMGYNPTASMPQPMNMAPMGYNPTAAMPQPMNMAPMGYNPTAAMPQPMNMAPMGYNPTAYMPQPRNMAPMGYNPTASMPQPRSMAPMGYNLIASMPQPRNMTFMTTYNPTASMPQSRNMTFMTTYNTPTPASVGWLIPSMATSNSMSSIPFSTPIVFSTQTTSVPNYCFSR
ncbi:hypothetical protein VZT92_024107 [Zoarces viviparus]|uniref:Mixed lineage kinase domain-containing protein n=1 Tax=Zoarces viviparus TaxID=48416 RepID=A0AAW1E0J9_ZOAVI